MKIGYFRPMAMTTLLVLSFLALSSSQELPESFLIGVPLWGQANRTLDSDQKACDALARAGVPVDSAEFKQPPVTVTETYGPTERRKSYAVTVPFCRVMGTLKPEPNSEIHFELWLPPRANWNGKFEGVGAGGSLGAVRYRDLIPGVMRKYAVVATDNGHLSKDGFDVTWAMGHPERIVDFGYRAEHVVTQAAKKITEQFYGTAPKYSYFVGCSQGGHHGMMEVQRFPEDYDGIIAGAPVYSWTDEMVDQAWNVRALQQIPSHALSKEKLAVLDKSVTKTCAGPDGVIADPRQCAFDPATLLCSSVNTGQCLTAPEIQAIKQMYDGPRTSAGVQLSPGLARGSEGSWERLWSNAEQLGGSWQGVFRHMVFEDPTWDLTRMNFDRDSEFARKKLATALNPDNPDLSRFEKHGGKLIVYHGWADDMVPSETSVNYFDSVLKTLGTTRVNDFYRLFMIPGLAHCGGGSGANVLFQSELARNIPLESKRDMLTALEHWIEKGEAPEAFVVSRVSEDGQVTRTRLVCPYPSVARYSGTGDPAQAQNWACRK